MSYDKIKGIKIENGKVLINSASNNLIPLRYSWNESSYFNNILNEGGEDALNISILEAYETGNFQGGENKYTRALKILYYLFKEEYQKFDWRNNGEAYEQANILRKTEDFKKLLLKALNTKIPKENFVLTKSLEGSIVYLKKCISKAYWTYDKKEAKKFRFKEELENIKSRFKCGEEWKVEALK